MIEFNLVAALLCSLALAFVLLPLYWNRFTENQELPRHEANVAAFKQRSAELSAEAELLNYSEQEMQYLQADLQHSLLDDVAELKRTTVLNMPLWPLFIGLSILLPLTAWSLYGYLGAQSELKLVEQLNQLQQSSTEAELRERSKVVIDHLQQQLADNNNQTHHWMLLARTQMQVQDYSAAELSFQNLMQLTGEDAAVMGLYAQARYMARGRQLDAVTQGIAERVLELQPNNGTVLGMMGMASFERQNYAGAVRYWQPLLAMLAPESSTAKMISQGIEQAKALAGAPINIEPEQAVVTLSVSVSVAEGLSLPKDASVFIYARAINGPKMPLAVVKRSAAELPLTVSLDETMAMSPAMSLSKFEVVELVARVSRQGIANAAAGDLQGISTPISSKSSAEVSLLIDQVLP